MSARTPAYRLPPPLPPEQDSANAVHWVEFFKDRVTEPLKEILQEDMDWTTSLPILERLNRLQEVEEAHSADCHIRQDP